jgi:hypothetical protein
MSNKHIHISLNIYTHTYVIKHINTHMSLNIHKHIRMSLNIHKHIHFSLEIHKHIHISLNILRTCWDLYSALIFEIVYWLQSISAITVCWTILQCGETNPRWWPEYHGLDRNVLVMIMIGFNFGSTIHSSSH